MEIKVAERRRALGLSQSQLAGLAAVGQHTVSDIERGLHIPRVDIAILISRALNSNVESLFLLEDGKAHPL